MPVFDILKVALEFLSLDSEIEFATLFRETVRVEGEAEFA
jgi:hypothetical protein